jgi:uncharacterized OB-fold protein
MPEQSTSGTWRWPHLVWQPGPKVTVDSEIRLRGGHCQDCGRTNFPDGASCGWCGGDVHSTALGPHAVAVAVTEVLHRAPDVALERVPYSVVLARFEDSGLDVIGLLVDPVDDVTRGVPLRVVAAAPFGDGSLHYAFAIRRAVADAIDTRGRK